MAKKNEWKNRDGVVYSTSSDFEFQYQGGEEAETLHPSKQLLYVSLDRSNRAGKVVTLIKGFVGSTNDLESLTKLLKTKCGVGGSSKEGEIIIQGDVREKVINILQKEGYKYKKAGG
jgi:translation initiation factor 1